MKIGFESSVISRMYVLGFVFYRTVFGVCFFFFLRLNHVLSITVDSFKISVV